MKPPYYTPDGILLASNEQVEQIKNLFKGNLGPLKMKLSQNITMAPGSPVGWHRNVNKFLGQDVEIAQAVDYGIVEHDGKEYHKIAFRAHIPTQTLFGTSLMPYDILPEWLDDERITTIFGAKNQAENESEASWPVLLGASAAALVVKNLLSSKRKKKVSKKHQQTIQETVIQER